MKSKSPPDPNGLKRIVGHLTAAGWVSGTAERDATAMTPTKLHVLFNEKGLEHVAAFKRLHDDLGDISEEDRHLIYDYLMLVIFTRLKERGEL